MDRRTKENNDSTWLNTLKQHFPWKAFFVGALLPIIVYYIFHLYGQPLTGAFIAAAWGGVVVLISHFILRDVNLFAILSLPLTLIEIIGTLITLSPDFYLATSAIDHFLWAVVFLISLAFSRPLILVFADAMKSIPNTTEILEFRKTKAFRNAWVKLTYIWAAAHLVSAIVLIISQLYTSVEFFLIIRTLLNLPLLAVLITISFWFPEWYWEKS
ncbi:VC0807 family protein [Winogradskyella sp.]|uniref:VC0807 family protein n=1 Tax=Winogradskyella sp. TaxID=1883156 RepID=UPI002633C16F|nr:VC0807 family protein [Winogradskyella sp.]